MTEMEMIMLDLTPSTRQVATLVAGTDADHLEAPTPCDEMPVRTLLAHLFGLSVAFRDAARKVDGPTTSTPPDPATFELPDDWRTAIPAALDELAEAWRAPDSWQGMTQAGGQPLPGAAAGAVALDEVVLHGWDLAAATGQAYTVDPAALDAVERFCSEIGDDPTSRAGLFGPRVPVAAEAPQLDRVLGLAGRDPDWTSPALDLR